MCCVVLVISGKPPTIRAVSTKQGSNRHGSKQRKDTASWWLTVRPAAWWWTRSCCPAGAVGSCRTGTAGWASSSGLDLTDPESATRFSHEPGPGHITPLVHCVRFTLYGEMCVSEGKASMPITCRTSSNCPPSAWLKCFLACLTYNCQESVLIKLSYTL